MVEYNQVPLSFIHTPKQPIACFVSEKQPNSDRKTVESFGEEWTRFSNFSDEEIKRAGDQYFDIVTDEMINSNSVVLDVGCGSGRWANYLFDKVKFIEAIDISNAVVSAARLTEKCDNVRITKAGIDNIPFPNESFDFVFSLGVMHHVPDTQYALEKAVSKLKTNGYFLLYLYYNLDNRGILYKSLFYFSNIVRIIVSGLPKAIKFFICDGIAIFIYLPLIAIAVVFKKVFFKSNLYKKMPLSYYTDKSFNIIRNDALDRFGTPLEKRFDKIKIAQMMQRAGLTEIKFSEKEPYWHVVGKKKR